MFWMYRKGPRGRFEGAIFEDGAKPTKGWVESPAALPGWDYPNTKIVQVDAPEAVKDDDGK